MHLVAFRCWDTFGWLIVRDLMIKAFPVHISFIMVHWWGLVYSGLE
jgi:hypothetical protein